MFLCFLRIFLPRDSHEISPTIGGVHKLMILLRDWLRKHYKKSSAKKWGGVRGTQTPLWLLQEPLGKPREP